MDRLEDYIRKHREELDMLNPPNNAWKRISKEISRGKYLFTHWMSIAAMVIVVVGSAFLLYNSYNSTDMNRTMLTENDGESQTGSQLMETEVYYNNLVNALYREANPLLTANPDLSKEFNTDISQLDSICSDIKKDLKDNVANQEVVEALIQNYRIKIQLLEDMLTILKDDENKQEKDNNYEL